MGNAAKILRYGLISDTHGKLHPALYEIFIGVEAILHAGDVGEESILDDLAALAPVHAVQGNVDYPSQRLPPEQRVELPFGRAIVLHSHLQNVAGRSPEGLARHFAAESPALIVFGHTHRRYAARHNGALVVNPGPAGKPRFRDQPSVALLSWSPNAANLEVKFIPLDWKAGT